MGRIKSKKKPGWQPNISLSQMIAEMIEEDSTEAKKVLIKKSGLQSMVLKNNN